MKVGTPLPQLLQLGPLMKTCWTQSWFLSHVWISAARRRVQDQGQDQELRLPETGCVS